MTERQTWEIILIGLDLCGLGAFGLLSWKMLPKRWWRGGWDSGDRWLFILAGMMISVFLFFIWLILADIAALWNIDRLKWASTFPWRGLGLRLLLITPASALLLKLLR